MKDLSPEEIRLLMAGIRMRREINNRLFCEWLEMSFNCPHCREAAANYQDLIRENDRAISKLNEPLTRLK